MKYIALTSHKYKVNLILLSRHCLVNNIRSTFYKYKVVSLFYVIAPIFLYILIKLCLTS